MIRKSLAPFVHRECPVIWFSYPFKSLFRDELLLLVDLNFQSSVLRCTSVLPYRLICCSICLQQLGWWTWINESQSILGVSLNAIDYLGILQWFDLEEILFHHLENGNMDRRFLPLCGHNSHELSQIFAYG